MTEVLIAGGAVMGASVAFWLTRLDPSIRLVVSTRLPSAVAESCHSPAEALSALPTA